MSKRIRPQVLQVKSSGIADFVLKYSKSTMLMVVRSNIPRRTQADRRACADKSLSGARGEAYLEPRLAQFLGSLESLGKLPGAPNTTRVLLVYVESADALRIRTRVKRQIQTVVINHRFKQVLIAFAARKKSLSMRNRGYQSCKHRCMSAHDGPWVACNFKATQGDADRHVTCC